ncbi:MAG: clostripain-related cysteine peptidase, partial [Thermodesulfobacteriota bacterium]
MTWKAKIGTAMLAILALLALVPACGGGGGGGSSASASGTPAWTFLVYIAGDNNLSPAAVADINEMEMVGSTTKVNVVVQAELSGLYSPDQPAYLTDTTLRGKIVWDGNWYNIGSPLFSIGNQDMAAPETLRDFIAWAVANYPAQHYALTLWSHGSGWKADPSTGGVVKGVLDDDSSGGVMSIPELARAIADSGVHFDVVNFDACLMAMYEVAYELSGLAGFLVFSEESEPGTGDPYDDILAALTNDPGMDGRALGRVITDSYYAYYLSRGRYEGLMSAVDMNGMDALDEKIRALCHALSDNMATDRPFVQAARDASTHYDYQENHDLGDFLDKLLANPGLSPESAARAGEVKAALASFVYANRIYCPVPADDRWRSQGLAVFLPRRDQVTDQTLALYSSLAVNQEKVVGPDSWYFLVNLLVNGDQGGPLATTEGNFLIWVSWDTDADVDLVVWEPNGGIAAPYLGASSQYGFLSADSAVSGESVEYYAAADMV